MQLKYELTQKLEQLPDEWCWCIGRGRLGFSCRIFEKDQDSLCKKRKRIVIIEYGEPEECIKKCLERFNERYTKNKSLG